MDTHSEKGKEILYLDIESVAHTFGVGLASSSGKIISNVNSTYRSLAEGGIHPREAVYHHCEIAPKILPEAIQKAKVEMNEADAVAFSSGPELGPALRTGATAARAFVVWFNKLLIPVHHVIDHIELASLIIGTKESLIILVFEGYKTITTYEDGQRRVLGETEDITIGSFLEKFGRETKISSSENVFLEPIIEHLAKEGRKCIDLPHIVKGNNSYSGMLTVAAKRLKMGEKLEDTCYPLRDVAFTMLTEASERALAYIEKKEALLAEASLQMSVCSR